MQDQLGSGAAAGTLPLWAGPGRLAEGQRWPRTEKALLSSEVWGRQSVGASCP